MSEISNNNKRIAKNTLFLYLRTILIMCIMLYTSRVILDILGVDDYGIYQVIAGFVSMFSVISGALSNAISRFLTFELGKGYKERISLVFSTSVNIQLLISLLVLCIGETLGVWAINEYLNISSERMAAANWLFQFSLFTFCIKLVSIPYNACIIAYEHMNAFAYISILEASLQLGICYLLSLSHFDKLITYSFLMFFVILVVQFAYMSYCRKHFKESRYHFILDKRLFKEMVGFAGWSFVSNGAAVFNTQGLNILINIFFGVTLNAARGIASQAENAIMQFVNNFTMAMNPQITKYYASGKINDFFILICRGSKFSYFLMLLFALPVFFETDQILHIWLKQVPDATAMFLRLGLIGAMINMLGMTGATACAATGKIRNYTIVISSLSLMVFPLTWLAFKAGLPVETAYIIFIIIYIFILFARLWVMKGLLQFPIMLFVNKVFVKIVPLTIMICVIPTIIIYTFDSSFLRLCTNIIVMLITTIFSVYFLGLTIEEKNVVKVFFSKQISKFYHIIPQ